MNKLYILSLAAASLLTVSCSKENGFGSEEAGEGKFLKSALSMDINADALTNTRAGVDVNPDDFTVIFTKDGQAEPTRKYNYGEMPEVVTLPAGTYKVTATYGENRQAVWESPYFMGQSEAFEVVAYEITSYVDPVVCSLNNIKVTVDFDQALRSAMSNDSFVEVKVGNSSSLNYGLAEADAQKAGYFMHSDEISLVATFNGTVSGQKTVETKALKNISKGNHYKITFKLHTGSGSDPTGGITGDIITDASVTVINVETNVEVGDEPLIEGGDRPKEDPEPDTPVNPDDPKDPVTPDVTALAPVNLDDVNVITPANVNGYVCVLNIKSSAEGGITEFMCNIDSDKLTPEELEGVGLAADMNLAETPDAMAGILDGLGLPTNVRGDKEVRFDISGFLGLLSNLGNGVSNFTVTITDANGTTEKTLILKFEGFE